ncbi:hypothetical protein AAIH73_35040, partial [Pseudomonas aeruginosa]
KPKPMEPPPFSILGVEYRGGERFLSVAPPGSTQLSQIYLIRQGDAVAGTNWRLTDLDDRTAHFDVAGAVMHRSSDYRTLKRRQRSGGQSRRVR